MTTIALEQTTSRTATVVRTRWHVLFGAIIIQLILGTVYGYSIFWQPLEREWLNAAPDVSAAGGIGQNHLKYAFGICLLSFAGSMVFAGRLQDLRGPRFTATLGGCLLALGFLIASQAHNLATFYLCHGVLMGGITIALLLVYHLLVGRMDEQAFPLLRYLPLGIVAAVVVAGVTLGNRLISGDARDRLLLLWASVGLVAGTGIGFAYVCPIAALVKWFPRHKGLVSGIAVAGFGLGAWLFSQKWILGAVGFIERYGIQRFFTVHAVVCLVAVCCGAALLCNPPAPAAAPGTAGGAAASRDLSWRQTLRTRSFYVVWLMFFSGALAGLMVIGILKPFAGQQLIDAATRAAAPPDDAAQRTLLLRGAEAVAWLAVFNAIGRIVWGLASDRIGRRAAMAAMFLLQAATMLLLATLQTPFALAAGAACVGFNFGGNFAVFPSLTADLFGTRNLGANYGWVFTSYGVAGVSGVALGNLAMQATGSYFTAFAIAAGLCAMSGVLAAAFQPRRAA
ncbi:MAG: hypothetical protein CHACPFDD_00582 [Phycisphaerae bacterium]|nr:hypothetical protein [Phycisphaerae bacterium]